MENPAALAVIVCALVMLAAVLWMLWRVLSAPRPLRRAGIGALLGGLGFAAADGLLLLGLPRLGISFGPPELSLAALIAARVSLFSAWAFTWVRRYPRFNPHLHWQGQRLPRSFRASRTAFYLVNLVLLAAALDAFYLEPSSLQVTRLELVSGQLSRPQPLRILQISDLHIERSTARERKLAQQAAALQPDLVLLTGDYLNTSHLDDPAAHAAARELLGPHTSGAGGLQARYGVYAVRGNVDGGDLMRDLFDGTAVRVLDDEVISPPGLPEVVLIGVGCCDRGRDMETLERLAAQIPPEAYTILLYHTPDLIETAVAAGIDLYLAGHTHGGQIRLPFYGALFTFSVYGKRYEMGHYTPAIRGYTVGATELYVSRGVGMEGSLAPRARFLCPPELVYLEVK